MKCVVLAAGEGKRMHPLTYTRSKVMLPIANKPLLEWNLLHAIKAGLKEFIFIVGFKSEMVRNYFEDGQKWGVSIKYINQGFPLGTAHAIGLIETFVDDFLVISGDTIFGVEDIQNIAHKEMSLGLVNVEEASDYGSVDNKGKKVVKIYEKMKKPVSNVINAGVYHFDENIFDFIKKIKKSSRGEYEITDAINLLLKNYEMEGIFLSEWRDAVYPWHLLEANKEILNKVETSTVKGVIEKNVTIIGNVIISQGSTILNGSYIEGPVIIGVNCKIGPNCYIRPYTGIGDNCHIGNACEVKNSILMDCSNLPHHNYVGDSIIGQNCNFGAGTKIANLRFDKKNIKVALNGKNVDTKRKKLGAIIGDNVQAGINSMINVGTLIGNDVFIGPGAVVSGEIKPKARLL